MAGTPPSTDSLGSSTSLRTAYERTLHALRMSEGLTDAAELANWAENLDDRLEGVRELLARGPDSIPCRLCVVPKQQGRARAYYSIPLEFQVGWTAIVQCLGPILDRRMPSWSFGYRLYRRHIRSPRGQWLWTAHPRSGRNLYMGFAQAWKPFRRYVNLTLSAMLRVAPLDEVEQALADQDAQLGPFHLIPERASRASIDIRSFRFPFLTDAWRNRAQETDRVWFAHIDLHRFFPSIPAKMAVRDLLSEVDGAVALPRPMRKDWTTLLERWSTFSERHDGFDAESLALLKDQRIVGEGLPVGLLASGFLSNVFMLSVDRLVERALWNPAGPYIGNVAHLRYVDDHILLATSREELCRWIADYLAILDAAGLKASEEKLRPEVLECAHGAFKSAGVGPSSFREWLTAGGAPEKVPLGTTLRAANESIVDASDLERIWNISGTVSALDRGEFVSTTLQRMSARGDENPDLLDESEIDERVLDLLALLHGSDRNGEVRGDTLAAYAASQLGRTPLWSPTLGALGKTPNRDSLGTLAELLNSNRAPRPASRHNRVAGAPIADGSPLSVARHRATIIAMGVASAVIRNPHKHRLLERWVQASGATAELYPPHEHRPDRGSSRGGAVDGSWTGPLGEFSRLLRGSNPSSDAYNWHLVNARHESLRLHLLSFLRLRMWQILVSTMRRSLVELSTTTSAAGNAQSLLPPRRARITSRLKWLLRIGTGITAEVGAGAPRRSEVLRLEIAARLEWRSLRRLVIAAIRPESSVLLRPTATSTTTGPHHWADILLAWTHPAASHPSKSRFSRFVQSTLDTLVRRRARWSTPSRAFVRDWLMQDPRARSDSPSIANRLLGELRHGKVPTFSREASTFRWLPAFFWQVASRTGGSDKILALQQDGRTQGTSIGTLAISIARQANWIRDRRLIPSAKISYSGIHRLATWGCQSNPRHKTDPLLCHSEPIRVHLLHCLVASFEHFPQSGPIYLSPENLFLTVSDWQTIASAVRRGTFIDRSELPSVEYREIVRDDLFEVSHVGPTRDQEMIRAAGLLALVLSGGDSAIDRCLQGGLRASISPLDVWNVLESISAMSVLFARDVVSMCVVQSWDDIGLRMQSLLNDQFGIRRIPDSQSVLSGLQRLAKRYAKSATRRDGYSLYTCESGLALGSAAANELAPPQSIDDMVQGSLVQPDVDFETEGVFHVKNGAMRLSDWGEEEVVWPRIWSGLMSARRSGIVCRDFSRHDQPTRFLVLPELCVPRRRIRTLLSFAQRENAVVIAGVEYRSSDDGASNEVLVAIPSPDRHPAASARSFWVTKKRPSARERAFLERGGIRFSSTADDVVFRHHIVGRFGVAICFDLYSMDTFMAFQGFVEHLLVPAHNRDTKTFDALAETAMRLLFCNVVVANSGCYGGSVAVAPYYSPHRRCVIRLEGQHIDTLESFRIPLKSLRNEQTLPHGGARQRDPSTTRTGGSDAGCLFKERPGDWEIRYHRDR